MDVNMHTSPLCVHSTLPLGHLAFPCGDFELRVYALHLRDLECTSVFMALGLRAMTNQGGGMATKE